jgi:hypothetical protein
MTTTTTTKSKADSKHKRELSARDVFKLYLADLIAESWCIDISMTPPRAFHAIGNQEAGTDSFRLAFQDWSVENQIRVRASEYAEFDRTFTDKIMKKLPKVYGAAFKPTAERIYKNFAGLPLANTYVQYTPVVPPVFVMPPILDEYLRRVFKDAGERKNVVQFIADIVQNPTRRPQFGLLLTGDGGSGKSTIVDIAKLAIGWKHFYHKGDYAPVFAQFSDRLCNNLIVCFDDATASRDTVEDLKDAITCKTRDIEIKYQQKVATREVFARVIVCSNKLRPLVFVDDERRFYVPSRSTHEVDADESKLFFNRLWTWLQEPGTSAIIYHWLTTVDLSDFVHGSTTQTDTHRKMMGLSSSVLDTAILNFIEDFDEEPVVFHMNSLVDFLKRNSIDHPKVDSVRLKLNALGLSQVRRKIEGFNDGKQIPIWQRDCVRGESFTPKQVTFITEAIRGVHPYP